MIHFTWQDRFLGLFDKCLALYRSGHVNWNTYYSAEDLGFLASIGYKPREFFDFVEDYGDGAPLPPAAALLVAAVRRDYFLYIQNGVPSSQEIKADDLPPKPGTSLDNTPYFARIVAKARAKLRGELCPDIMFGCGGDRAFLSERDIHPADFLRAVWAAGDDDAKVVEWVHRHGRKAG